MQEVMKKEIVKLLDIGIIYPIADSPWLSPIHCIPKKGGITVVTNEKDELVPTRTVTCWRVCIDYRKLNEATAKDHFPLQFMDQMLERLAGNKYFCFLDGFFGYFQIPIDPMDQEKTTFTCPFSTYAYRRMPFSLCNALATFQRCMLAIFHDIVKESVEKCHFMVKDGIMLGHKVSEAGLEVDKAKIKVISKLPPSLISKTIVHNDHSALGHLFKKQDAKPRLILWILLLQKFDIEIKDRKGTENVAADHLSQIENDEISDDSEVDDNFPGEALMEINTRDKPWFADFANYLFEYILVAIDYVSKWAEAQALPTNDARVVITFLKKPFCRFGMPKALISDRGTHFYNPAIWSRKVDGALWAFCTAYKTPTGTTPYKLIYGKNCHLPFEIEHRAYWALKNCNPDLIAAGEKRMFQLQ
ncbi:reverse transcriptase domain-containing protein [Tanacetum coccineum]